MIQGLAYNGISLATGGTAAYLRRVQAAQEADLARGKAEFGALVGEVRASGLTRPDSRDLLLMVARRELSFREARELMRVTVAAYPWYGR